MEVLAIAHCGTGPHVIVKLITRREENVGLPRNWF